MLTLEIRINGKLIRYWKAVRRKGNKGEFCAYEVNDGTDEKIVHHYDDGAVELARKLILREPIDV